MEIQFKFLNSNTVARGLVKCNRAERPDGHCNGIGAGGKGGGRIGFRVREGVYECIDLELKVQGEGLELTQAN